MCSLALELVDVKTGQSLPGIVQIHDAAGKGIELPELVNRGQGIEQPGPIHAGGFCPPRDNPAMPALDQIHRQLETELAAVPESLGQTQALRVPLVQFAQAATTVPWPATRICT
jgi:hypothetical protein